MLIFVYGTLMRGEPNQHHRGDARFVQTATTRGRLYNLGSFPAMTDGDGEISGEVYEATVAQLRAMDRLEGHPNFYRRRVVQTSHGPAACYMMSDRKVKLYEGTLIPSGDWREVSPWKP